MTEKPIELTEDEKLIIKEIEIKQTDWFPQGKATYKFEIVGWMSEVQKIKNILKNYSENEKQILTALQEYPKLKEKSNQIDFLIDYFVCDNYNQLLELLKSNSHRLTDLLVQNLELKETIENITKAYYSLQQENNQLKQLKQRVDERIKELENSPDYETGYALEELQKLLKPKEES